MYYHHLIAPDAAYLGCRTQSRTAVEPRPVYLFLSSINGTAAPADLENVLILGGRFLLSICTNTYHTYPGTSFKVGAYIAWLWTFLHQGVAAMEYCFSLWHVCLCAMLHVHVICSCDEN